MYRHTHTHTHTHTLISSEPTTTRLYLCRYCSNFHLNSIYFIKLGIYFYFWLHWVFAVLAGFSLVVASRDYSSLRRIEKLSFSLCWLLLLPRIGSRSACFSSCNTGTYLLCGIWDPSGIGIESMSPASAGRLLSTAPRGTCNSVFWKHQVRGLLSI